MPKVALNVRVPEQLAERLRADARRYGRSLDSVAETILSDFINAWTVGERGKFYQQKPIKRAGRPIESDAKEVA